MFTSLIATGPTVERARVPGGWIVIYNDAQNIAFCADSSVLSTNGPPPKREPDLSLVA